MSEQVRVRLAPSPTGYFHIGTARSALFNYLFAHKHKGTFLLRIEDTDKERSKKEFEDSIIAGLELMGLKWDEFYRQSERTEIYKKYLQQLLDTKKAFWCDHTPDYLEKEQKDQATRKEAPRHICDKREGSAGVIRLAASDSREKIIFDDIIRGHVEFEANLTGDFVIAKDLETPLFHFVVVVDDYEMRISHVIRGEEHLANTPKHILIQHALGFTTPTYAHLPLILAPDRTKLSKRHGATSLVEYMEQGYLPQAMLNYLFLLGATPPEGKEVLSLGEMIQAFDLHKVHKAGAIFDVQKLDWINSEYIKSMPEEELLAKVGERYTKILPMVRERIKKFSDIKEFDLFFETPNVDPELLKWKKATLEESRAMLGNVKELIEKEGVEHLRNKLDALGAEKGDRGLVYWPFRVALSGQKFSPDPVDIAMVLGKEEVLKRITNAL